MSKKNYTSVELEQFKNLIIEKKTKAEELYKSIKEILSKQDNGTSDTGWTFNMMDDGSDTLSKEELNIQAQRQEKFIDSLRRALVRIENKTYGVCVVTGELIPKERLLAVPHATMSIKPKQIEK